MFGNCLYGDYEPGFDYERHGSVGPFDHDNRFFDLDLLMGNSRLIN